MAKNKTMTTNADVLEFITTFANSQQKIDDSLELMKFMEDISGYPPKMWGTSIIGFGQYHYKYASGHEGDSALIGFSPRKSAISLYVFTGLDKHKYLIEDLGKFTMGKACIYIKKLSDIDLDKLKLLILETINYLEVKYGKI